MMLALAVALCLTLVPAARAADAKPASSAERLAALVYFRKDHLNDTVRPELYPLAVIRKGSFEKVGREYFGDLERGSGYHVYHGSERVGVFELSDRADAVFHCSGIPVGLGRLEPSREFDPFAVKDRRVRRISAYLGERGRREESLVAFPATSVSVDQERFHLPATAVPEGAKEGLSASARERLASLTVRWAQYGKELERPEPILRSFGVFDLDLDGGAELAGFFTQIDPIKIEDERRTEVRSDWLSLMLWMGGGKSQLRELLSEHMDVKEGSWGVGYELLGVLDFDGDGKAEVLVQKTGWETTDFLIYALRDGKLDKVFEGAGYGC